MEENLWKVLTGKKYGSKSLLNMEFWEPKNSKDEK